MTPAGFLEYANKLLGTDYVNILEIPAEQCQQILLIDEVQELLDPSDCPCCGEAALVDLECFFCGYVDFPFDYDHD